MERFSKERVSRPYVENRFQTVSIFLSPVDIDSPFELVSTALITFGLGFRGAYLYFGLHGIPTIGRRYDC